MYIKQDAWSKFFSTPLYDFNPESLLFLKQSGDAGYLAERDRLFAAMYGEWDVLLKDVNKMCNAVSTLNYTVVPTIEEGNEAHATAKKVADIVKKALWMRSPNNELGEWRHTFLQMIGTLYHAICRSVNVHEIIWERSAGLVYPRCYAPVQPNYYGWAVQAKEPDRLVLYRDGNPYGKGEPFPKGKFIVAINPNGPDHPMRAAQFISLVGWFGAAKWGLPWLMKYCQVFGLPWRKFTVGSEEDKAAKLAELASNPVISDTVVFGDENVEIINAAASGASIPQAEILRLAENACHKLILGQTLTSDTSDNGGSLAQAKVHAGVMADEVMYVGNYVCEILNQQLIPEIVRANFGAIPVELIPELRCAVPQAEANLDQLQMYKGLQEMGVRLVEADVCDKFGVPIAGPDDKVLEPAGQQAAQPGMPGEVPQPDDEPPTPGPQKPTLAEELNNEPIEAAAAPDVPDIDALSAAAEAAAEDAHRRWSEPFFKALASALDQGMTPSEILSSLEDWNPDTEALADALAVTARVSLGHGPDDIEAANPGGCNQYGHGWVDNICPWGGGAGGGSPMGTAGSPGGMFTSGPNEGNVSKGIDPDEEKRKKEEAAKAEAEAKRKEAEAKAEDERKAAEEAKAKEEAAKREAEEKAKREAAERAKREAEERAKKEAEEKAKREEEERRAAEEKARKEKEQKAAEDDSGLDKKANAKKVENAVASRAKKPKDTSLIPMPVDKTPKMNAPVELGNYAKMPTNDDDKSAENLAIREAHALNLTNHQMQNWNSLSVKQRALLKDYTDDSFEDINRSLYDSRGLISDRGLDYYMDMQAEAVGLHQAINKFSTPYNMMVTRGTDNAELVNMGLGELMPSWGKIDTTAVKAMQKKLTKGEKIEYTNPAFSSTSLDSSNTQYKRSVIIKTFVPKGTHAVYAEPFSVYGKLKNGLNTLTPNAMLGVSPRGENELLLNSGTKHRVLSVKVVDNTLEIYTIVEQS
jgi:phage gp29-like protein